jgi:hypothetical protein
MTSNELDRFTHLCRRVLEAKDDSTFRDRVKELNCFLDVVLPSEQIKAQMRDPVDRRLTFIDAKAPTRFRRNHC